MLLLFVIIFINVLLIVFVLFHFFSQGNPLPGLKYIECGLTHSSPVHTSFYIVQQETHFNFQCGLERFYYDYINKDKCFVHAFLSSKYDLRSFKLYMN